MSVCDPQLRIAQLESELKWAHLKIQVLEEKLRQQRIRMLGPQSETLSNLQLELLADEEPSATSDEVAAEAKREPIQRKPARERISIIQRKVLTPNDFPNLDSVAERLLDFQYHWEATAEPFEWNFTRQD